MGCENRKGRNTEIIPCACGCGNKLPNFDKKGKPRRYIKGHQRRKIGRDDEILRAIKISGSATSATNEVGLSSSAIKSRIRRHQLIYKVDLTKTGGNSAFGRQAEIDAKMFLYGAEDVNKNNCKESPYDLLWNGLRVDVKGSTLKKTTKKGNTYLRWAFRTNKQEKCDLFMCLGYGANKDVQFVIIVPSSVCPTSLSIPVHLNTRWAKYMTWKRSAG